MNLLIQTSVAVWEKLALTLGLETGSPVPFFLFLRETRTPTIQMQNWPFTGVGYSSKGFIVGIIGIVSSNTKSI